MIVVSRKEMRGACTAIASMGAGALSRTGPAYAGAYRGDRLRINLQIVRRFAANEKEARQCL